MRLLVSLILSISFLFLSSCTTVAVVNTEAWMERTASIDSIRSDMKKITNMQILLMENQKKTYKNINVIKTDLSILYTQLNVNINQVKNQLASTSVSTKKSSNIESVVTKKNSNNSIPFPDDEKEHNSNSAIDVSKMFLMAKKDFNSGDYKRAQQEFAKLAKDYPSNELADDCLFWVAECDYKAKRYSTAIKSYKKLLSKYPKSETLASALYKLGLSYKKVGKKKDTKKAWNKLIKSFPKSDEAALAKARLGS